MNKPKPLSDPFYKQARNVQIAFRSFLLEGEKSSCQILCSNGIMPLGTGAKLLTHRKSHTLQNSENTALNTGLIPFISRASLMQQSCFKGVAVKSIIKQSYQINGFMTAEFPKVNPLVKATSWYFQEKKKKQPVCNQIPAGPTATPNHFN